jgi:hydroxymethylbilane synthase
VTGPLRIATRKSQLALWQAEHVAGLLRAAHPGLEIELVPLLTQGDRIQDRTLAAIGGKGLFIKELEVAIEELRADIAVHSMKDVPADLPDGLIIAAVLKRADPRDALVTTSGIARLEDLPRNAVVGTSSLRRQAQIRALRADLRIVSMRGNVDTRLRKLDAAGTDTAGSAGARMDAIVLACAGLIRLGLESRITARLDPTLCLPAVTQGVIGIECRQNDSRTLDYLTALEDPPTRLVMNAERAFAARLGGSCQSPIAAYAELDADQITLRGLVAEPDGSLLLHDTMSGRAETGAALGRQLAERMLAAGAGPLLERLRASSGNTQTGS